MLKNCKSCQDPKKRVIVKIDNVIEIIFSRMILDGIITEIL